MSAYNIFDMASGQALGRFFARSVGEGLNAMAGNAGFSDYAEALRALPAIEDHLLVTDL